MNIFELELCLSDAVQMQYKGMASYISEEIDSQEFATPENSYGRGICRKPQAPHSRNVLSFSIFFSDPALVLNKKYKSRWVEDIHRLFKWRIVVKRHVSEQNLDTVAEFIEMRSLTKLSLSHAKKVIGHDTFTIQLFYVDDSLSTVVKTTTRRSVSPESITRRPSVSHTLYPQENFSTI